MYRIVSSILRILNSSGLISRGRPFSNQIQNVRRSRIGPRIQMSASPQPLPLTILSPSRISPTSVQRASHVKIGARKNGGLRTLEATVKKSKNLTGDLHPLEKELETKPSDVGEEFVRTSDRTKPRRKSVRELQCRTLCRCR